MALPATTSRSTAVCILGMHRSGTSALARLLNLLGVDLGRTLIDASTDNPKGFWENRLIVDCHTDLLDAVGSYLDDYLPLPEGWENAGEASKFGDHLKSLVQSEFGDSKLWGFKDPRACRLLPLWHRLFPELGAAERYVLMVRHPFEVHQSLAGRSGYPANKSMLMYVAHLLEAELQVRGRENVVVTYDQVMSDWTGAANRIGQSLKIDWPVQIGAIGSQVGEFLDGSLRHHRASVSAAPEADADFLRWATTIYDVLAAAATGREINEAALDRVRDEFQSAQKRILPWRPAWSMEEEYGKEIRWNTKITADVERLTRQCESLGAGSAAADKRAAAAEERLGRLDNATIESSARATMAEARMAEANARAATAEARAAAAEEKADEAQRLAADLELRLAIAEHRRKKNGTGSASPGILARLVGKK